jgi:chromosomal replication initiation ATPase DnaA
MEDVIKQMTQPELIDHIITNGSKYLGIGEIETMEGVHYRTKQWERKRYLISVLCDHTIMTFKEIAEKLGYKQHSVVIYHYKNMKDDLSGEVYGSNKTKQIYNELLTYLKLQDNDKTTKGT